jgi:hypothetical protein
MSTIHARADGHNSFSQPPDPPPQRAEHTPPASSTGAASCLRAGANVSVSTDTVGADWGAVIDGCRDLLAIAFGEYSNMDTFERACRDADCRAAARPQDPRALRARRLLADEDISYDRTYAEFMRARPTPEATVDALVYALRRGVVELTKPDTLRRLSDLDQSGLEVVCLRVQSFHPDIAGAWSAEEADLLITAWEKHHDQR